MAAWRAIFWIVIVPLAVLRRATRRRGSGSSESTWRHAPAAHSYDAAFFRSMRGYRR